MSKLFSFLTLFFGFLLSVYLDLRKLYQVVIELHCCLMIVFIIGQGILFLNSFIC